MRICEATVFLISLAWLGNAIDLNVLFKAQIFS